MIPFVAITYIIFCLVALLGTITGTVSPTDAIWKVSLGAALGAIIAFCIGRQE